MACTVSGRAGDMQKSSRVSSVFSDALNPGYIFVNIGVDAHIPAHEVSDLDPLELVLADDSSNGHLLPENVRRGERWSGLLLPGAP